MDFDNAAPVIAGVDGSPAGYRAAVWAAQEAEFRGRRLALLSVNAWPSYVRVPWGGGSKWDVEGGRAAARDILDRARRAALDLAPNLELWTEIVEGLPARVLIERSLTASMLVVGRRGRGAFTSLLLGSSAAQVATHASCPVVLVPEDQPAGGPVVVGADIGDHGQDAISFAFDEASRRGLPLTVLRAWTVLSEEPAAAQHKQLLSEALAGWSVKYPDVPVHHGVARGHPGRVLVEASRGACLLVVGARGAGGFAGLRLGSVADAAIRHAECPVAVAR